MNQEKAREFFSAYYEGTLESGLRQTFEQRLRADSQLQQEYTSFEETMSQLETLKFEEIEVPSYLSDRIATRLEEVQEKRQAKAPIWSLWLRGLAFTGVAGIAILGAIMQFGGRTSGTAQAGGLVADIDDLIIENGNTGLTLRYQPKEATSVEISSDGSSTCRSSSPSGD